VSAWAGILTVHDFVSEDEEVAVILALIKYGENQSIWL
jgi:hypothetical protein